MAFQFAQAPVEPASVTFKVKLELNEFCQSLLPRNAGDWLIIRENRVLWLAVVEGEAGFGDLQELINQLVVDICRLGNFWFEFC